jgi:hypothetical protein
LNRFQSVITIWRPLLTNVRPTGEVPTTRRGFEWSVSIFIGPNTRSVLFSFSVTQTLASYLGDCNSGQLAACIGSGKKRLFMEFVFSVATSKTPKVPQAACRNVTRRWRIASVHQTTRRNQRLQLQVLCFLWSRWKQTFGIGGHERPQLSYGRCVACGFLAHKHIFYHQWRSLRV